MKLSSNDNSSNIDRYTANAGTFSVSEIAKNTHIGCTLDSRINADNKQVNSGYCSNASTIYSEYKLWSDIKSGISSDYYIESKLSGKYIASLFCKEIVKEDLCILDVSSELIYNWLDKLFLDTNSSKQMNSMNPEHADALSKFTITNKSTVIGSPITRRYTFEQPDTIIIENDITESTNVKSVLDNQTMHKYISYENKGFHLIRLDLQFISCMVRFHYIIYDKNNHDVVINFINLAKKISDYANSNKIYIANTKKYCGLPNICWTDMYATDTVCKIRSDFEFFMNNKSWYTKNNITYKRGYLFVGSPGNGKTMISKLLMKMSGYNLYTYDFLNDTTSNSSLIDMFTDASQNGPSIILFEDVDRVFEGIKGDEGKVHAITKDTFLNCMDGYVPRDNTVVIATANNPDLLDKAITKRPGRFDCIVKFDNPSFEERVHLLKKFLDKSNISSNVLDKLATNLSGYNMASINELRILCYQYAFRDNIEQPNDCHLEEAYATLSDYLKNSVDSCNKKVGF